MQQELLDKHGVVTNSSAEIKSLKEGIYILAEKTNELQTVVQQLQGNYQNLLDKQNVMGNEILKLQKLLIEFNRDFTPAPPPTKPLRHRPPSEQN